MRILILGAGIAGLALAGFLKAQGLEPVIVEKAKAWSRLGYGITLWGNGIHMLERLGLADQFYAVGDRIDAWMLRNGQGQTLKQADLQLAHLPPLTAIHRADLHRVLLDNVPQPWIRMETMVDSLRLTGPRSSREPVSKTLSPLCFGSGSMFDPSPSPSQNWSPRERKYKVRSRHFCLSPSI